MERWPALVSLLLLAFTPVAAEEDPLLAAARILGRLGGQGAEAAELLGKLGKQRHATENVGGDAGAEPEPPLHVHPPSPPPGPPPAFEDGQNDAAGDGGDAAADPLAAAAELLAKIGRSRQERESKRKARNKENEEPGSPPAPDPLLAAAERLAKIKDRHRNKEDAGKDEESGAPPTPPPPTPPQSEGRRDGSQQEQQQEDPFAHIYQHFGAKTERLRRERDAARDEFTKADQEHKAVKARVAELERLLKDEQSKLKEAEHNKMVAQESKRRAEKAVTSSYTEMVSDIMGTADSLNEKPETPADDEPAPTKVMPKKSAVAILFEDRHFKGKSVTLECCGSEELKPHGIRRFRSAKVSQGLKLTLQVQTSAFLPNQDKGKGSIELWGNARELDQDFVRSYSADCCSSAYLDGAGVTHSAARSVYLYPEPDFGGNAVAFLPGDYEPASGLVVRSVRVPAGSRVSLFASFLGVDGGFIDMLLQDCAKFPRGMDAVPRIKGIKVRKMTEGDDLHGAFVYFSPNFAGRPQLFQTGEMHEYPEEFAGAASVRATNGSEVVLQTETHTLTFQNSEEEIPTNFSRPQAILVNALCEPRDLCGPNGKCVRPPHVCNCFGGYMGARCHLRFPDETSSVVCERNAVVVGEVLPCVLLPRKENEQCLTSSMYVRTRPTEESEGIVTVLGSPLSKTDTWTEPKDFEANEFSFDLVFNATGNFNQPLKLQILGKPAPSAFVPRIAVVDRCDGSDTVAAIACGEAARPGGGLQCLLTLSRGASRAFCPIGSISMAIRRSFGERQVDLRPDVDHEGPAGTVAEFDFEVDPWAVAGPQLLFLVRVSHGATWETPKVREVQVEVAAEGFRGWRRAKALLRDALKAGPGARGTQLAAAALQPLESCARGFGLKECIWLLAEAHIRVGNFSGAQEALQGAGGEAFEALHARLSRAEAAEHGGATSLSSAKAVLSKSEAAEHATLAEGFLSEAILLAPFSARLQLRRAEAALHKSAWQSALDAARLAAQGYPQPPPALQRMQVLFLTGQAYFAWGFEEAAMQNFRGCASLGGAPGIDECLLSSAEVTTEIRDLAGECARRGEELRRFQGEFRALIEAMSMPVLPILGALWDLAEVERRASTLLETLWPGVPLEHSFWGIQAAASRCAARRRQAATNAQTVAEVCAPFARAYAEPLERPMLDRLQPASLPLAAMLAHASALEVLASGGNASVSLTQALEAAQAAEVLLAEGDEGIEDFETLAVEVKVLVARLLQKVAQDQTSGRPGGNNADGNNAEGNDSNSSEDGNKTKEDEKKKPFDPYEMLGVPRNATSAEIKKAYRQLALKYHPDKNTSPEATQIFIDVQKAYEVLIDPNSRKSFDSGADMSKGDMKMKPMKFRVVEVYPERGMAKFWWYDPNTGEEGYMEMPHDAKKKTPRPLREKPNGS